MTPIRRTLFAKGNLDLRDSLLALRLDGRVAWNGINEVLRARGVPARVVVRHETFTRSDAVLAATGAVPPDLPMRDVPWSAYPPVSQFSRALFQAAPDAYFLSAMPDLCTTLWRHRDGGWLLHPEQPDRWPASAREWLHERFVPAPLLSVDQSMAQFHRLVEQLRSRSAAPILVYNVSTVMPGQTLHCWEGVGETFGTRAMRFNLALTELSRKTGISIVDVDGVVARMGADRAKRDHLHLTAAGCEAVAREVARILEDLNVLPPAADCSASS